MGVTRRTAHRLVHAWSSRPNLRPIDHGGATYWRRHAVWHRLYRSGLLHRSRIRRRRAQRSHHRLRRHIPTDRRALMPIAHVVLGGRRRRRHGHRGSNSRHLAGQRSRARLSVIVWLHTRHGVSGSHARSDALNAGELSCTIWVDGWLGVCWRYAAGSCCSVCARRSVGAPTPA